MAGGYREKRTYVSTSSGKVWTRSYCDSNGVVHTRDFASEKAADKWARETMPARDSRLQVKNWEREMNRPQKKAGASRGQTRSTGSCLEYFPPETFAGVDARWDGLSGNVGGRRFTSYRTWRKWAQAAADKAEQKARVAAESKLGSRIDAVFPSSQVVGFTPGDSPAVQAIPAPAATPYVTPAPPHPTSTPDSAAETPGRSSASQFLTLIGLLALAVAAVALLVGGGARALGSVLLWMTEATAGTPTTLELELLEFGAAVVRFSARLFVIGAMLLVAARGIGIFRG